MKITDQFHPGQEGSVLVSRLYIHIDDLALSIAVPDARVVFDRVEADADHSICGTQKGIGRLIAEQSQSADILLRRHPTSRALESRAIGKAALFDIQLQ